MKIMNIKSSQKYRVALINVETQSWTVVTCLAAFMSVTAPSILPPAVTVCSTTCHMNEIWRSSWCEAADTYKCEFFCDFQKLHCWCFHPADRPSSSLNSSLRRFVALKHYATLKVHKFTQKKSFNHLITVHKQKLLVRHRHKQAVLSFFCCRPAHSCVFLNCFV